MSNDSRPSEAEYQQNLPEATRAALAQPAAGPAPASAAAPEPDQTKAQKAMAQFVQNPAPHNAGGPTQLQQRPRGQRAGTGPGAAPTPPVPTPTNVVEGGGPTDAATNATRNFAVRTMAQGGLLIAFFVLIAAIWLLIPTKSGQTRAQLLWLTFIGKTYLGEPTGSSTGNTEVPENQPNTITSTQGNITTAGQSLQATGQGSGPTTGNVLPATMDDAQMMSLLNF